MLVFYPVLRWRPGGRGSDTYLIDRNDAIVCAWGGLRGPVGLALAIQMNEELPLNEGARVLFHIGGIALLTLTVNGLTSARLMAYLGLTHTPAAAEQMKHYLKARVSRHVKKVYAKFKTNTRFQGADAQVLTEYCSVLTYDYKRDPVAGADAAKGGGGGGEADPRAAALPGFSESLSKETLCRRMFISLLRSCYNKQLQEGLLLATIPGANISGKIAMILFESVDIASDRSRNPLCDWVAVERSGGAMWKSSKEYRLCCLCVKSGVCGGAFSEWFDGKEAIIRAMDAVLFTCFIDAHKEAQHELGKMWGDPERADTPEEQCVLKESQAEVEQAFVELAGLQMLHGDMVRFVENFQVAHFLFETQREAIEELVASGACTEKVAQELLEEVQVDEEKLDKENSVGAIVRQVRTSVRSMSASDSLAAYTRGAREADGHVHGDHHALGHDPERHGHESTWGTSKAGGSIEMKKTAPPMV